jgi:hypothetical protein
MKRSALTLIAFAAVLASRSAHAGANPSDDTTQKARKYFDAGKQAYEASRFLIAATAFEEAYQLSPRPQILFSLAQAIRQQYFVDRDPGRLKRAVELFKEYMQQVPQGGRRDHASQHLAELEPLLLRIQDEQRRLGRSLEPIKTETKTELMITSRTPGALASVDGEEASEMPLIRDVKPGKHSVRVDAPGFLGEQEDAVAVDGRLVVVDLNLKEQPAVIALHAPDGADVTLDGRLVGAAPLATALEVTSGRHYVVVTEKGAYPFARDVLLDRGEKLALDAKLETTTQRTISYWCLGIAGGLFAGGVGTGIVALTAQKTAEDIDQRRTSRMGLVNADLSTYSAAVDRRDRFAPISGVLLGSALALGVAGALLYFIDAPRPQEAAF